MAAQLNAVGPVRRDPLASTQIKLESFILVWLLLPAFLSSCGGGPSGEQGPAVLTAIRIISSSLSFPLGTSQQFTATGIFSDGSTRNLTTLVTWSSSSPTVVSISSAGFARTLAIGSATINAAWRSISTSTSIVVDEPALVSIVIKPNGESIPLGMVQQFIATGTFTDTSIRDLTNSVTWSSSATDVARINNYGLATSVAAGNTTITAASGHSRSSAPFTVTVPILQASLHQPLPEQYIWLGDQRNPDQVRFFRHAFMVRDSTPAATLYIAGPKSVIVFLNGVLVANAQADPGALTQPFVLTLDISTLLQSGRNALALQVSRGDSLAVKVIPAESGVAAPALAVSGPGWKGQLITEAGWERPDHNDSGWSAAQALGSVEADSERFQGNRDSGMYRWPGYHGISPFLARTTRQPEAVIQVSEGKGLFSNLGALVQTWGETDFSVRLPAAPVSDTDSPSFVLDFGREINGRLEIASSSPAPGKIQIQYGESLEEAIRKPYLGTNELVIPPWATVYGPKSGFRYAHIRFVAGPTLMSFRSIGADFIYYPVSYRGWFDSSDLLLNRIWATGAYTAHLTMQERIWDAPKRDRFRFAGDLQVGGRTISAVFADQFLTPKTRDSLISDAGNPLGDINTIPGYSAAWIMGQADYYRQFGDLAYLESIHKPLVQLLEHMETEIDAKGLFAFSSRVFPFVDWSPELQDYTAEAQAATHFIFYKAFSEGVWLLRQLEDTSHADGFQLRADALKQAAQRYLLGPTNTYGARWQTNAMAVFSGLADAAQTAAIFDQVLSKPSEFQVTPYYNYYAISAMAQAGHRREALDFIRSYWGGMLKQGATTFWEAYDLRWPKDDFHAFLKADNTQGFFVSLCHMWSSGPTAWLVEQVLGVQPIAPGFQQVVIRPELVDLQWARGTVPTPRGIIFVDYRSKDGFHATLELPEKTEAFVSLPVAAGQNSVRINGVQVRGFAAESGTRSVVILQGAGRYELRTQ